MISESSGVGKVEFSECQRQAHGDEGEGEWVSYPGPRDVWGSAITQKHKVHQNVLF